MCRLTGTAWLVRAQSVSEGWVRGIGFARCRGALGAFDREVFPGLRERRTRAQLANRILTTLLGDAPSGLEHKVGKMGGVGTEVVDDLQKRPKSFKIRQLQNDKRAARAGSSTLWPSD